MLNVKIITIGKLKEKYLKDACDEYLKRLSRFCKAELLELDECRLPDSPSRSQIEKALASEGEAIKKHLSGYVTAMCIEGKQLSSTELSNKLEQIPLFGKSSVSFIIGSSFGLSDDVKSIADLKLSMSCMTFPHQLARVMLLEQIYRGFQIISGGKYHK